MEVLTSRAKVTKKMKNAPCATTITRLRGCIGGCEEGVCQLYRYEITNLRSLKLIAMVYIREYDF